MRNAIVFVYNLDNRHIVESAQIKRLASRSWIERGAIQINAEPVGGYVNHAGLELSQIAILIVQAIRHPEFTARET